MAKTYGNRARTGATVTGALACLAVVGLLAGCSGVRESLGLSRNTPDEFAVVSRAPLSIPPVMALEPPRPGSPRPQERSVREQTAQTLFGAAAQGGQGTGAASGEVALLARAGASDALPNIRALVDKETSDLIVADQSWVDSLIFWRDRSPGPYTVVDPIKEAERLQSTVAEGRPITEGETPTIERRGRAPLEGLF